MAASSSSIVVKVKHGDTLRRFNAQIVDKKLDLNMTELREKICSLFNFAPDADITLTYIDEDSDVVTLVNDDDLQDAVHQALNPFRITVKLNSSGNGKNYNDANGKSTRELRDIVSESLENVPEPLRGVISQISNDLVSKASAFAPDTVSEIVDLFSKMGFSNLGGQHSRNQSTEKDPSATEAQNTNDSRPSNDCPPMQTKSDKVEDGNSANPSNVPPSGIATGKEANEPSSGNFPCVRWPPVAGILSGSSSRAGPSLGCPFSGLPLQDVSAVPLVRAWKNGSYSSDKTVHRGIRCDGCGVYPIVGARYKSNVKYDYDLCGTCFSKEGNDTDYTKMEHPVAHLPHMPFKFHDAHIRDRRFHRGCKAKYSGVKLDSRFIVDVNIFDGTVMAPLTPFTKIWRMRNNGSLAWPPKTQLVWMGGDKLSNAITVEVEIPSTGLPVDHELDVAVDFISPELAGRYVSYWRMASPTGQKFGQRVWVLIQVDTAVSESSNGSVRNLNLNLPPLNPGGSSAQIVPESGGIGQETLAVESRSEPEIPKKMVDLEEPAMDPQPNNDQDLKFPINNSLLVGEGASNPPPISPSAPYPIIDFTEMASPYTTVEPTLSLAPASGEKFPENELLEDKLLKELDAMGFEHIDMNKEVLRMKEYDLEQTVDELCGVSEWDPLLEELQEMGFQDKELNKKLLEKNNGSIQRVVLDLVTGEKA